MELPKQLRLATLISLLIFGTAAHATPVPAKNIPSAASSSAPNIDGVLDDAIWQSALTIELDIETRPLENTPARVKTTAYLIENGHSLLVAFDARDPEPENIRAYLSDRDRAFQDDFVGITVDTFNDERRGFEFFVNALGVQMDLTIDDISNNEDETWDAIWQSAGKITETGYIVEMAIPFSQLRFPRADGEQTWGLDALRFRPRDSRVRLSNNPTDRSRNCYLCQLSKIRGFANAKPGRNLEITPTLTASRTDSRDDVATDPLVTGDTDFEPGLSVRWGITPDLTANLALNPDFSQVEADVAQLDVNNQFALFFPEKRPFFLEGADYFSTPLRAVFTRTVADPSVGAKLTGKSGAHTFGAFIAEDDITNLLLPGSLQSDSESLDEGNQAIVGRYSLSFGDASNVGALFTSRRGSGYSNQVAGFDSRWRINDQHNIRAQFLHSQTEYPDTFARDNDQTVGRFDGDALAFYYDYESRNWFALFRYEDVSPEFRADSGFMSRVDYDKVVVGMGRIWHGEDDNWWQRIRINGDWDITHDSQGRVLERELEAYASVQGPLQSFLEIGGLKRQQLWDDQLFSEQMISAFAEFQPRRGLQLAAFVRIGDRIDFDNSQLADLVRVAPRVNWNLNQHLRLNLRHTSLQLDSKAGPEIFDAQLSDLRLTWQFTLRSFLRMTVQRQDVRRNQAEYTDTVDARDLGVSAQLLYSYKINPQTVLFVGYSDNFVDDDELPELTRSDRTLFLKVGYAFTP